MSSDSTTSGAGRRLKAKYLRKLSELTDFGSTTEVPFYFALPYYVASKIHRRKSNHDEADKFFALFNDSVMKNAELYKLPVLEEQEYHSFSDKP